MKPRALYRNILVPTDGSRQSEEAAQAAIRLGRALGARLTAVHVVPEANGTTGLEAWAHQDAQHSKHLAKALEERAILFLETIREIALKSGVSCECHVVRGNRPHEEILRAAAQYDCDLIVMASHRLSAETGVMLAGETIKVLARGPLPVLIHN